MTMSAVPTDGDLVLAAQAGDAGSLAVLLERHRSGMYAVAVRLLGYSPDADDAVQDAIVVALRRIGEVRDPAAVSAWLRAIVRNGCRMRRRAPIVASLPDPLLLRLPAGDLSPEDLLERQALRDWLWHALAELSESLRLTILLRYFTSVTAYEQIAALCDVPVGTVRSRLSQARRKLADALLATASLAHAEADALAGARRHEFTDLLAAAERGALPLALAGRWATDVEIVGPQGQSGSGLGLLVHAMDSDLTAGVRQRPATVLASRDLTIVEADLLSPSDDPHHCPPTVLWLQVLRAGRVRRLRLFHPRPAFDTGDGR
jgi:RNA polymerase sigma-70 factor (ECF subfamily)